MDTIKKLAIAFMVFNALDLLLTLVILELGGAEVNPIMRFVFEQPLPVVVAFKMGLGGVAVALLMWRKLEWPLKVIAYTMIGLCLFNASGLVAVWL